LTTTAAADAGEVSTAANEPIPTRAASAVAIKIFMEGPLLQMIRDNYHILAERGILYQILQSPRG